MAGRTHLAHTLIWAEVPRVAGIAVVQAKGLEVPLLRLVGIAATLVSDLKVYTRLLYVERVMSKF